MEAEQPGAEGKPPFFRTWRGAYALVLGVLVIEVLLLTWWSRSFS